MKRVNLSKDVVDFLQNHGTVIVDGGKTYMRFTNLVEKISDSEVVILPSEESRAIDMKVLEEEGFDSRIVLEMGSKGNTVTGKMYCNGYREELCQLLDSAVNQEGHEDFRDDVFMAVAARVAVSKMGLDV